MRNYILIVFNAYYRQYLSSNSFHAMLQSSQLPLSRSSWHLRLHPLRSGHPQGYQTHWKTTQTTHLHIDVVQRLKSRSSVQPPLTLCISHIMKCTSSMVSYGFRQGAHESHYMYVAAALLPLAEATWVADIVEQGDHYVYVEFQQTYRDRSTEVSETLLYYSNAMYRAAYVNACTLRHHSVCHLTELSCFVAILQADQKIVRWRLDRTNPAQLYTSRQTQMILVTVLRLQCRSMHDAYIS